MARCCSATRMTWTAALPRYAQGLEATIEHVFDEDGPDGCPPTVLVAARGASKLRDGEFLNWLFGGYVHEAGYADPSWPTSMRLTDHSGLIEN